MTQLQQAGMVGRRFCPTAVAIILIAVALVGSPSRACAQTRDEPWDARFQRSAGWTGADGAGTIVLPDGRILWLYGDTWMGEVRAGKHVASKLVNNTIAVHPLPKSGLYEQEPAIEFHSGAADPTTGKPTAWLVPTPQSCGEASGCWFWPVGGGAVVQGVDARPRLAFFLWSVARTKEDRGIWSFRTVGGVLATVDDISAPVGQWRVDQHQLPHARSRGEGGAMHDVSWGQAALRHVDCGREFLYVYGLRSSPPFASQLIVARVPAENLLDFDQWRFLAGPDQWSGEVERAVPLADGVPSEFSVERLDREGKQPLYLMVQSELPLQPRILMRTAPSPIGPWSKPKPIFTVPELARNKSYFTYAAKGHLALSRPGELLITYVVNATDFQAMIEDADIYRPRFIRVPLADIDS